MNIRVRYITDAVQDEGFHQQGTDMPTTFFPTEKSFTRKVKFLTNGTLDDILGDPKFLPKLGLKQGKDFQGNCYPLTKAEQEFVWEDGEQLIGVDTPHDLMMGQTVVYDGKKYAAPVVEFHFRNDSTRHMWGTPVTLEETLPLPEKVEPIADRCCEKATANLSKIRGFVHMSKKGYITTEDRYALWLFIPFTWIKRKFKTPAEYKKWLRRVCK